MLCQAMLNGGIYKGVRLYRQDVIDLFTSEQNGKPSRGLGFERGSSFMGRGDRHYDAFGHAGFTGTHVVMNKTNKTAVVFLTNKLLRRDLRAGVEHLWRRSSGRDAGR